MTDIKKGDRVRVTVEGTVHQAVHPGRFWLREGDGRLSTVIDDHVVSVEVLVPARPEYKDGDVVQATNSLAEVAIRSKGAWRWTHELDFYGWGDDITAGHLESGYYKPLRIGGKPA